MWLKIAISLFNVGLKWLGAKFVQAAIDSIVLFYSTLQERSIKEQIAEELKGLDIEARIQAARARRFADEL